MKKLFVVLSITLGLSSLPNVVNAAQPNDAKAKSGSGSIEVETKGGPASPPADAYTGYAATAVDPNCYSYWWLSGNHTWNWKWYVLYSWNDLNATTWTSYGTAAASCNIPLVSNWLRTQGSNRGATFNAAVNKTEYNVSTSTAYNKVTGSLNTAASVCGALVNHSAYAFGVQLNAVSRSGC